MAKTLTIYLAADLKKLNSGVRDANGVLGGLGNSLTNMVGPALIGAAAAAGALAVKLGVDGVKAAMDDQVAAEKLAQTMENLGLAHDTQAVEDFIYQLERSLGIADTELRPAYDRLVRSIGDTTKAQEILKLSLDVAAGSGKSLQQVTDALGRAYDGNIAGLTRLGAGIDAATVRTGDMELITAKLSETFSGQAQRSASTFEGQIGRLTTATDNLKEAFGAGLLGALSDNDRATNNLVSAMEDLEPILKRNGEQIGLMVKGLVNLLDAYLDVKDATEETSVETEVLVDNFASVVGIAKLAVSPINAFTTSLQLNAITTDMASKAADTAYDSFTRLIKATGAASETMAYGTVAGDRYTEMARALGAEVGWGTRGIQRYEAYLESLNETTNRATGGTKGLGDALEENNPRLERMQNKIKDQIGALSEQVTSLQAAEKALRDYASAISQDLLGEIDLGAVFDPENVQGSIDAFSAQIGDVTKFSDSILMLADQLPNSPGAQLLLQNILGMGTVSGSAFIEGLTTETANNLVTQLDAAATAIEGNSFLLANKFHGEGIEAGIQTIKGMAEEISVSEKKLRAIGKAIGKPIGANIKEEIAKAVAEAVAAAQAAGERARAEAYAAEQARQARITEQQIGSMLSNVLRNNDARIGTSPVPILT